MSQIIETKKAYLNTISISEIQRKHNGHWFDADTKSFFKSKWDDYAVQNEGSIYAYFVSSEQHGDNSRKYSVRRFNLDNGQFDSPYPDEETIFAFQRFDTKKQAEKAMREYLKTEPILTDKQLYYQRQIKEEEYNIERKQKRISELREKLKEVGITLA
jgi:hypothetical protein